MRFAIRDDDTNYFTTPEDLEHCYKDIWHEYPPTLCLISKVKGKWSHWVHQIYKDRHDTDWDAWTKDDTPYPIEGNGALIDFLSKHIKDGKLDVAYHAKHHRNEDPYLPQSRDNNYVRGAEYFTTRDLTGEIKAEVGHLDRLLGSNISVFTPPQNLLSMTGYRSVIDAGLNICGGGIAFYKKEKDWAGIKNMFKQATFKVLHKESDYPRVLHYSDHNELAYHYPLQPSTRLEDLIYDFDMVRKYNGDFVLSTHYVEFDYPMVWDEKVTMKKVLLDFLNHVSKFKDVEKMTLSQMLK